MASVIDLHSGGGGGLETASDGNLGGKYLLDDPIRSYLGEDETPAFVVVNKRNGVTVERESGSETYKPSRSCRTLVAVTDLRVLIAVGGAGEDGDRIISVPLSTITDITTGGSIFGSSLRLATDSGEAWSIACRGDLDSVVEYLQRAQRAWSRAERFEAEVEDRLDTARDRLAADDFEGTLEATDDAMSMLAHGIDELQEFQMGDGVVANAGFQHQRETIREIRRQAHAGVAADRQEAGEDRLQADEYQSAHDRLAAALEAIEQALATEGPTPPDDQLTERRDVIQWKLAELEVDPKASAAAALGTARSQSDSEERAEKLRAALGEYRDLLGLCWGPDADFDGDPDEIQSTIVTIVDELVAARADAAQRTLVAADRLAVRGRTERALEHCRQAETHLDAAREVVDELAPDREAVLDMRAAIVRDQRERIEQRETAPDDEVTDQPPQSESVTSTGFEFGDDEVEAAGDGQAARKTTPFGELDREAFTRLVADVWQSLGWEASAFTDSLDQYDVMATQREPVQIGALVWAVHRPDGELEATIVDRCDADRSSVDGADVAVVVTSGLISGDVRVRAAERDVKLLGGTELLELVERIDLDRGLDEIEL